MSYSNERSAFPTVAQIEKLLDRLERNPDIAKGLLRTQNARQRARTFWQQIQLQLNSVDGGAAKSWKQWMKYWTDKKGASKKKAALRAANMRKDGARADVEVELTAVEERIVAMMGGEHFIMGDSHLRNPLIHESSTEVNKPENSAVIEYIELPEPNVTNENSNDNISSSPEYIAGTSYPKPHINSRAPSMDMSEPESTSNILKHSPRSQTPTQSPRPIPRYLRTSATTCPRRRGSGVRASPTFQRKSQLAQIMERFVNLEERRVYIEESNASLLRGVLERTAQREHTLLEALTNVGNRMIEKRSRQNNAMMAEALKTLGEGLKALSDTIKHKT